MLSARVLPVLALAAALSFVGPGAGCKSSSDPQPSASAPRQSAFELGRRVYQMRCVACHGNLGDGRGGRMNAGQPRSFIADDFRSAPKGEVPSDAALIKVITEGLPGTAMPPFPFLRPEEKQAVALYLRVEFFHKRPQKKQAPPPAAEAPTSQPSSPGAQPSP